MLKKFDLVAAPNKEVLIRCFRIDLWLSILAQIDSRYQEIDLLDKMLEKAIKNESKAALQFPISIKKIAACC